MLLYRVQNLSIFWNLDVESKELPEGQPPGLEPDSRVYWNW